MLTSPCLADLRILFIFTTYIYCAYTPRSLILILQTLWPAMDWHAVRGGAAGGKQREDIARNHWQVLSMKSVLDSRGGSKQALVGSCQKRALLLLFGPGWGHMMTAGREAALHLGAGKNWCLTPQVSVPKEPLI